MCSEIDNPYPSRTQVAPGRTGDTPWRHKPAGAPSRRHRRRIRSVPNTAPGAGGATAGDPRRQAECPPHARSRPRYIAEPTRAPYSARRRRRRVPASPGLWRTRCVEGIYRGHHWRVGSGGVLARGWASGRRPFRHPVRSQVRISQLHGQYHSPSSEGFAPRWEGDKRARSWRGDAVAPEAWPAHPGRAGAARRRRTCVRAQGSG